MMGHRYRRFWFNLLRWKGFVGGFLIDTGRSHRRPAFIQCQAVGVVGGIGGGKFDAVPGKADGPKIEPEAGLLMGEHVLD